MTQTINTMPLNPLSLLSVYPDTQVQIKMTEITTILQQIYRINQDGGHGSRRKVSQLLLELGLQPNK